MKKLFLALLTVSTMLFSCKKEEVVEPTITITRNTDTTEVFGKTWELVDAKIYTQNSENSGDNKYYDHFGFNRTTSNLDPFTPTGLEIDVITLGTTTWEFNNSGFILNDYGNPYGYNDNGGDVYKVIVGGTARIFTTVSKKDGVVVFKCLDSSVSIDNQNHSFFSYLTFVEKGTPTEWNEPDAPSGYSYGGVLNTTTTPAYTLNGTKWVVTRYNNGLSGSVYPNDTLNFISDTDYTINGGVNKKYSLSSVIGNNNKSLSLWSFTTLGGNYSGQMISSFIDDGVINNSQFVDMFDVNNTVTVWMEKL